MCSMWLEVGVQRGWWREKAGPEQEGPCQPCWRAGPWTSLVVQWLRLCTTSAEGSGSIPGQGTRPHMVQLRPSTANESLSKVKKKKKNFKGLPQWKSTLPCRGLGFNLWSGKIPHAVGQLSPCAAWLSPCSLECVFHKRSRCREKPAHCNWQVAPTQPGKACAWPQRPSTARKKERKNFKRERFGPLGWSPWGAFKV